MKWRDRGRAVVSAEPTPEWKARATEAVKQAVEDRVVHYLEGMTITGTLDGLTYEVTLGRVSWQIEKMDIGWEGW
jgi:hypothetical protein